MTIILPGGQTVGSVANWAITFCIDASYISEEDKEPFGLTKHYSVVVQLPKLGSEEFNGLLVSARQLADNDFDIRTCNELNNKREGAQCRINISIVMAQRLDN